MLVVGVVVMVIIVGGGSGGSGGDEDAGECLVPGWSSQVPRVFGRFVFSELLRRNCEIYVP